jgi:transcriptional regulator with XRE-family HTH domain
MSRDFDELMHEIDEETRRAGPKAEREYAVLGASYRLAVSVIALRRAARLTQRQLAAKSRVQQADISRIEAGDANPTLATIAALAYALGAEVSLGSRTGDKSARARGSSRRTTPARQRTLASAARRAVNRAATRPKGRAR